MQPREGKPWAITWPPKAPPPEIEASRVTLLHCRFCVTAEMACGGLATGRRRQTLRGVPSSSLRAVTRTGPGGWEPYAVAPGAVESWAGRRDPTGQGCGPGSQVPGVSRGSGLWLRPCSKSQAGSVPSKAQAGPVGGQPLQGRDRHRPSKCAVICSKVFPLVSGTQHKVKRTLRMQKAEASQKAP